MSWKHPRSQKKKKIISQFLQEKRRFKHLFTDFKEPGVTVSDMGYYDIQVKLNTAIKNKRLGELSDGVILLHRNARSHVAKVVQEALT